MLIDPPTHAPWPVSPAEFGCQRRVHPVSDCFGFDRGRPVDRYFIESFLAQEAAAIRGRVLEVGDDGYTRHIGGERVDTADVLNVNAGVPRTTIVANLDQDCGHIPSETFDCIILTQTLQYIFDLPRAARTLHRILKPGGSVLATAPGISQKDRSEWPWYWTFTSQSMRRVFEAAFLPERVQVEAHGNVLTAIAFLQGLAVEELTPDELAHHDPAYEVLITAKATK